MNEIKKNLKQLFKFSNQLKNEKIRLKLKKIQLQGTKNFFFLSTYWSQNTLNVKMNFFHGMKIV